MPRMRDFLWAIAVCAGLTWAFHYRPLWSARRFVQRESQTGFVEAYAGHRWRDGQMVAKTGRWDPLAAPVLARNLHIQAEEITWNGQRVAFVVRHAVTLLDGSPGGFDASTEVHVELRRHGGRWEYTRFQVRGGEPMPLPIAQNPWTRALSGQPTPLAGPAGRDG